MRSRHNMFYLAIALIVLGFVGVIIVAVTEADAVDKFKQDCHAQNGYIKEKGRWVGKYHETTYYCLTGDGKIIDIYN